MGSRDDVDRGAPGRSLQRQYEQRRDARERQVRARHPRLGGLFLALSEEPATTANLRRGAEAEVHVAERLRRRCGPDVELLFNRRLGSRGSGGDIDILAVTPNGVHLVDVKRYHGKAVRVRTRLLPLQEQLVIGGRDHTRLLDSVQRQRDVVRRLVDALPDGDTIPLRVALCFVDADLPLIPDRIRGVAVLGWKGVARQMNRRGSIEPEARAVLLRHLARHLPSA